MSNTHGIPDSAKELQAIMGDLQSPCIISSTFPAVPVTSLTLAAFATRAYVKDGTDLRYVEQSAMPITLSGADGQFWLAAHKDTSSAVASWTRVPGTHYLWRSNPTKPAAPAGGLILSQVTVAGGVITAVSQATIPRAPLSLQDAGAVAITGGTVSASTVSAGTVEATTGLFTAFANARFNGHVGFNTPPSVYGLDIRWIRSDGAALLAQPLDSDTNGPVFLFSNLSAGVVGSIFTNATTTSFNTTSDPRLKDNIEDLPNPLQVIQGLRPVAFRWRRNQEAGRGLLANEVQALVPEAVTGDADATDGAGNIIPQMIDYSKLVPYLVGAVKALMALNVVRGNQIQALTARVAALEAAQP